MDRSRFIPFFNFQQSFYVFKKSVYSRSRSIKLTFWPVDQLAVKERKLKEIWEINPEKQEPVELEKIPDLCELDNNELLIDDDV